MIGRKLLELQNGEIVGVAENNSPSLRAEELKNILVQSLKRAGHVVLVETIRLYVRVSNFLKQVYQEVKIKIESMRSKNGTGEATEKQENKFLKMVSEYKHKIRTIKHKIKKEEEEKNL